MEPVGAVHHHRLLLGQLAHPLADALGVAPGDTLGDVLLARDEVLRPRVESSGWACMWPTLLTKSLRNVAESYKPAKST
jgi:hypothetical protein